MLKRKGLPYLIYVVMVAALVFILYKHNLNEHPRYIHAWTQADRLAMALRYTEADANFFLPRTYALNTQFPAKETVLNPDGITRADFPIHEYMVSRLMKLFGKQPAVFRIYTLLIALLGLFYLFKFSLKYTNSLTSAVLIVVFVFCSPVYTYYQNGFIPTISSLSVTIIALYHYLIFTETNHWKNYTYSILLLLLASLCRLPFSLWLIGVATHQLFGFLTAKNRDIRKVVYPAMAFALIALNFIYNNYLGNKYGSMFLTEIMPANDWREFKENLLLIYKNWHLQYFSFWQYVIVLSILIALVLRYRKIDFSNRNTAGILFLTGTALAGSVGYFVLMQRQFVAHDYYFLDTFFLPLILLGVLLVSKIKTPLPHYPKVIIAIVLFILMVGDAKNIQANRRYTGDWDRTEQTFQNLKDAEHLLDSLQIPSNAKILMLDGYSPNNPFILMNRRGYFVLTTSTENINTALQWDYDYLVMQNQFIESDIIVNYPTIYTYIKKVFDNNRISIYQPIGTKPGDYKSNVKHLKLLSAYKFNFDSTASALWDNTHNVSSQIYFSGKKAGLISADVEFGATFKVKDTATYNKNLDVQVELMLLSNEQPKSRTQLVVSGNGSGKDLFYESVEIGSQLTKIGEWQKLTLKFKDKHIPTDAEIKVYLWNQDKSNVIYYDDITISLFN